MKRAREIWVGGFPSFVGGADSELDHQIDLWRSYDVDVHLVPMWGADERMKSLVTARGCHVHEYSPDIFKDKIVVSFCNGTFLEELPKIVEEGKPQSVIWFNCMTWMFDREKDAHANGLIDHFGFVSQYQRSILKPKLEAIAPVVEFEGYRPFYNVKNTSQSLKFNYRTPDRYFGVGRVSRDDSAKFPWDMWHIFNRVCAPIPKKTFILGYGPHAHQKCGSAPDVMDWATWTPGAIPVSELFDKIHCLIHKTGGSRESYCRVLLEAHAAGVAAVVEDDFAFPELVIDGVTGFRCSSSDEMSFRASELAFDEPRRKKMVHKAYNHLIHDIANRHACWTAWDRVLL